MDDTSTRTKLIETAARLFRQQGYHGTGVAQVLAEAGVPKGSLYHHFPDGKADLARAAADWTADVILRIIDDAFTPAPDWLQGATTLCHKLARLLETLDSADACPISALMFDGPQEPAFRDHAAQVLDRLQTRLADHATRLHADHPLDRAETLLIAIDGAWTLARARRDAGVLRRLPARLPL